MLEIDGGHPGLQVAVCRVKVTESAPEQLPATAWHSLPKELQDLAERPEELGGNDIEKSGES